MGSILPWLRSQGEASWVNEGKNKGKLSVRERIFSQVRWGWTVGGRGEGGRGVVVQCAGQPVLTAEAPRQRLEEPGANPVPGGRGYGGADTTPAHNGFSHLL